MEFVELKSRLFCACFIVACFSFTLPGQSHRPRKHTQDSIAFSTPLLLNLHEWGIQNIIRR
jgi:hypothetical protein